MSRKTTNRAAPARSDRAGRGRTLGWRGPTGSASGVTAPLVGVGGVAPLALTAAGGLRAAVAALDPPSLRPRLRSCPLYHSRQPIEELVSSS